MRCVFAISGIKPETIRIEADIDSMSDARREASRYVGELLQEHPMSIWDGDEVRVEVSDHRNLSLFSIVTFGRNAASTIRVFSDL